MSMYSIHVEIVGKRRTPKSLTLEIHHGGCFTPIPSRSYVGGKVSSVNVDDIDEFCLRDLKDMVVKLGYGLADLMYYHFLIPRLGLNYGLHPLNVDADMLEMAKYVKDYKIILVYVEHGSSDYANTRKEITGNEITGKQMVVHVEGIGLVGKFKEAKVDADNETKKE
ncbi:hypothetical protein Tco_1198692 [Tanacetum coccineum]